MHILMCRPKHYEVSYEINAWMHCDVPVSRVRALQQWQALYDAVCKTGADVSLVEPAEGLPDMVFVANAGLVSGNRVWVSQFKEAERQSESELFYNWFKNAGFTVENTPDSFKTPPFFEGAGDALFMGDRLIGGYGFRSDRAVYDHPFFQQLNVLPCELIDPSFYHLDTCFCPLDANTAICYLDAFSEETRQKLADMYQLILVSEEEAKQFACNAIVLGQHIILPSGCPNLRNKLEKLGYTTQACDMSEFIKSGGACKCLTLRLDVSTEEHSISAVDKNIAGEYA